MFYISGHGFGHASRQIEIIRALGAMRPDVDITVKTSVPGWFFDRSGVERLVVAPFEADTGVVQIDSLQVDVLQSIERSDAFHRTLPQRTAHEAADLCRRGAVLVVGDIPPLACAAGATLGVPTVAIGNFTWDWIYDQYPETAERAPALVSTLAEAYQRAHVAWRLPLHAGFAAFDDVVEVPLVARRATVDPASLRQRLGLPRDQRLALFAFGRYGVGEVDWPTVQQLDGYHVVFVTETIDEDEDQDNDTEPFGPAFTTLYERTLAAQGVTYADLLAAVDVVITKPGFGLIAECAANATAMLYTDRGRFPEYEVLVEQMPAMVRCAYIDHDDLFDGRWQHHLDGLLAQAHPNPPALDGATVIGNMLAELLD